MAYPPEHRRKTRERIVAAARKLFNLHGYDAVTIDQLMREAGLTRGGFYFHFASKAQLYREAIAYVLVDHPSGKWMREGDPRPLRERIVDAYLGDEHFSQGDESCPLVTHAAEASRRGGEAQTAMKTVLEALLRALGGDEDRERALATACLCVGGLSLARAVGDEDSVAEILRVARQAAR